ncbi:hypothetical protein [Novosphingobium album (ex Liu et al. 2023)]|uniref:Uncharacterized protein n=1 Tax=Novosphingobium album (ex Liu et al. 2023) TaxID=3031130 RepID=A0ABT5WY14_9SPHN|nr:hypothetical protein [Novosphingobium album (ex Liu et al. 2023)]MDE8654802.1 hypothetical protein [Novosphingobium album (ex Liu et al. 2023)]
MPAAEARAAAHAEYPEPLDLADLPLTALPLTGADRRMARTLAFAERVERRLGCVYAAIVASVVGLVFVPAIVGLVRSLRP